MLLQQTYGALEQLSGQLSSSALLIGFILGAVVLVKALKTKQRIIFLFFLCVIFTLSPWYPSGFGYIYWLVTDTPLPYTWYVFIGLVGIPIAILAWLDVYMTTIRPEKKKAVLLTYAIYSVIFEIYLMYFLYLAPGAPVRPLIGEFDNPNNITDIDYRAFVLVYLASSIGLAVITGIHFSIMSMKIEEGRALKKKGQFLLIAFILFGISAVFDAVVPMNAALLILIRIMLMATTFFFYVGFILPKWMKKILSIEE